MLIDLLALNQCKIALPQLNEANDHITRHASFIKLLTHEIRVVIRFVKMIHFNSIVKFESAFFHILKGVKMGLLVAELIAEFVNVAGAVCAQPMPTAVA